MKKKRTPDAGRRNPHPLKHSTHRISGEQFRGLDRLWYLEFMKTERQEDMDWSDDLYGLSIVALTDQFVHMERKVIVNMEVRMMNVNMEGGIVIVNT